MALLPRITLTAVAGVLLFVTGCKPTPSASAGQATPPTDSSAPRQPSTGEFSAFFQTVFPAVVKLSEVKIDAPVRMPNTSPASNVWLFNVKLTVVPAEDLLSLPPSEDAQVIGGLINELNSLVAWRNLYVQSPYARVCGEFKMTVPATMPQLLVVAQPKDHPLPPIYGKIAAEWQVDHWQFQNIDLTPPKYGDLRATFQGPVMLKGSPEAEALLKTERDAIAQARQRIEAIRSRYSEQVAKGTKPGTAYQGRVSFRQNVLPCELRFLDPPAGGDAHFAAFEVRLPSEPACSFIFNAKVTTELPIPIPGATPTPTNPYAVTGLNDADPVPTYNISPRLDRTTGKMDERTLPGQILQGNRSSSGSDALLLLDGRIEGIISYYNAPGINLSVQQTNR